jgi:hypothetical protein
MDYWAFRTGDKDEYGRDERFVFPFYTKDVISYWNHPLTTLGHKTHPLLSALNQAFVQNKDYYGVEVRSTGAPIITQLGELAEFGIKQYAPFWMRGVAKEVEREGGEGMSGLFDLMTKKPLKIVAAQVGIMPAPAAYNKSNAETLMTEIGVAERPSGALTKEKREHFDVTKKIRHAYLIGKDAEGNALLQGAIQQGQLSKREIGMLKKSANETPMSYAFKRLKAEDALRVWAVMTPEEKVAAGKEMAVKMRSVLLNASPENRTKLLPGFREALAYR